MQIDLKTLVILILVLILIALLIRLSRKTKIKQTRYKSDIGDMVKSRAELIIANWLFYRGVKFIYEKKPNANQRVISDFYLVDYDVYIEFWGLETPAYLKRKKKKIKIYKKNCLKLIEMNDDSLRDLNQFFAKEFAKFKIRLS
ncbi:helicase IV [Campylobacter sp. RM16188]|uniref:helicase IV n=1 Tax=Campylobacter sp. RM16188 TaxID=1705725 RepID=UPI001555A256|nr:helicase IV [Campylobacter sp. RM16188]